jgi:hypothetical protein
MNISALRLSRDRIIIAKPAFFSPAFYRSAFAAGFIPDIPDLPAIAVTKRFHHSTQFFNALPDILFRAVTG